MTRMIRNRKKGEGGAVDVDSSSAIVNVHNFLMLFFYLLYNNSNNITKETNNIIITTSYKNSHN